MAEEEIKKVEEEVEKDTDKQEEIVDIKEEKPGEKKQESEKPSEQEERGVAGWEPKTKLGKEVKDGKIKNIDEILDNNRKILEGEIVDFIMNVESDLISIGQSKGKFGGGKRRIWRQTQRKTKEGNVPTFSTLAVVGDKNGHVGIGSGRSMETLPAREKAIRKAKLAITKIERGCGSFDCSCDEPHSIPSAVSGASSRSYFFERKQPESPLDAWARSCAAKELSGWHQRTGRGHETRISMGQQDRYWHLDKYLPWSEKERWTGTFLSTGC